MILNILGGRVTRRVARHQLIVFVLIYPNVVNPHRRRHERAKTGQVQLSKAIAHAKVDNHGQWFVRNGSLANVSIRSRCAAVEGPSLFFADVPSNVAVRTRVILKSIDLVGFAVIPVVVEICHD